MGKMATAPTRDDLLEAVKRMKRSEFQQFLQDAVSVRARNNSAALPARETAILLKINKGLPAGLRKRYAELRARRTKSGLSEAEQQELLRLTDEIELHDARRAEALVELAGLRGVPVRTLMKELGIKSQRVHD